MKALAALAVIVAFAAPSQALAGSFSTRSLSDARVGTSRAELVAQRAYSERVITRITAPDRRWLIAPRHATCWSIRGSAYRHACNRARLRLITHRWLVSLASARLARLYPVRSVFPPHHALWLCISGYEGGVRSVNPNGHYGELQMHWNWGYGITGAASDYSQAAQEWAAERAYGASHHSRSFLYGQWFDYDGAAGACLRYA